MGTKIRVDGEWVDLEINSTVSPDGLDGSWTTTSKQHNTFHTNGTSLIYVSAIFRVNTIGSDSNGVIAGSSAWVYVSDPGETGTNLSDYTNISRVRDNGTNAASNLYLNVRFFVPPSCKYIVKLYNHGLSDWGNNSRISTLSWNEFGLNLTTPDHNFTSLDSNSNNFSRATKVSSSSITSGWSQFAQEYGAWHEPGNAATIGQAYSTTYTINITKQGDYTLEYFIDDSGTITFDGTQVASAVKSDATWSNNPPSSVTLSNVSIGSHTLVVTVTNDASSNNVWDSNPAGIGWRIKPFGT